MTVPMNWSLCAKDWSATMHSRVEAPAGTSKTNGSFQDGERLFLTWVAVGVQGCKGEIGGSELGDFEDLFGEKVYGFGS